MSSTMIIKNLKLLGKRITNSCEPISGDSPYFAMHTYLY